MFCTKCGAQVPGGQKFCSACGAAIAAAQQQPQPGYQQQPQPGYQQQPQPGYQQPQQQYQQYQQYQQPYAQPQQPSYAPPAQAYPYNGPMASRKELKSRAKEQIRGNIGMLFVCSLVLGLIASTMIGAFFVPALSLGMVMIYFGLIAGKKPELNTLFCHSSLVGRVLWLGILQGFFTSLWSLLFIVPGIIKALSYSMASYILAENPQLTAREAMNESKRITKGHIGELFVLSLSFFGWYMLTALTFGIAMIYAAPYIGATKTNYYRELRRTAA
jgi:uncharacterized membrane protein